MVNNISSKKQAINLRKQGKSYSEINKVLGIPKSTLSSWLKDLPLSQQIRKDNISRAKIVWAKNIINYNRLRSIDYQKNQKKLIERYSKEIPQIDKQALFWIGLALFWAEGGKREKFSVRFVNSDPRIIKTIMRFYREVCKVPNDKFRLRIYLHPNIKESDVVKFWSEFTEIPKNQFYKSQELISSTSKRKRNFHRLPNGTLHVYIGDAGLSKKIKGWIRGLSLKI